jgi:hypothetical protein
MSTTKADKNKAKLPEKPAAVPVSLPATLSELVNEATHFIFPAAPVKVRFLRLHRAHAYFAGDETTLTAAMAIRLTESGHVEELASLQSAE